MVLYQSEATLVLGTAVAAMRYSLFPSITVRGEQSGRCHGSKSLKFTRRCAAVDEASQSLISITEGIAIISGMNIQIAAATEEQSTVVENINRNISDINDITQRNADTGQDAAQACQSLLQLAHRLDSLVANFKL